jgi:hypothetical protein
MAPKSLIVVCRRCGRKHDLGPIWGELIELYANMAKKAMPLCPECKAKTGEEF